MVEKGLNANGEYSKVQENGSVVKRRRGLSER